MNKPTMTNCTTPNRVQKIRWQFGIQPEDKAVPIVSDTPLATLPGQITFITGPSGSGKSSTLRALSSKLADRAIRVDNQRLNPHKPIVDQVAAGAPLAEAISILTACGLGEPRLWLRRPTELADGERFRARLSRAVGLVRGKPEAVLLVDEFCAILHRRLACAMAYNLRKMVTARNLCLVVATTHDDLQADLQPNQILELGGPEPHLTITTPAPRFCTPSAPVTRYPLPVTHIPTPDPRQPTPDSRSSRRISFFHRLHITQGRLRDYKLFESMHYRRRTGLGPFDKIFVLRDGVGGQALGVVVYGYSPLSSHLRNVVTAGQYQRNGRLLNRDFRILRRLIIHPDVRGCGLAHHLVRETLPKVGTKYVECLAVMGAVNPVFERSGMTRLGTVDVSAHQHRVRDKLATLGVDPLAPDFAQIVASSKTVRDLVSHRVHRWVQATTGRPRDRIRAMPAAELASAFIQLMGTAPIYYLWSTDPEETRRLQRLRSEFHL